MLTSDDLLGELDELVLVLGDHHVADGVVAFDVTNGRRVQQEVLSDHLNVAEPVSPVRNYAVVL